MKTKLKKGKSSCCNDELMEWFGNATAVMFGGDIQEPTLLCMECSKPTTKNL